MDRIGSEMDDLLARFVAWAEACPEVRAAAVIGSRARADRPADEWSDLDLLMIVTDPARFLDQTDWLESIGTPWLTFLETTATRSGMERRVLFEGGLDVDFVPVPQEQVRWIAQHGLPADVAGVVRRGIRFVVDKDGFAMVLGQAPRTAAPPRPPDEHEFREVIHDFLYHAVWTAKKLRRGEVWTATLCLDGYMKQKLLTMLEWHARAINGPDHDTWHNGRFLEQWADPRALADLRGAFAHYDAQDVERALHATIGLFRWVALETAGRLNYTYPSAADEYVRTWLRDCLNKRVLPYMHTDTPRSECHPAPA